MLDDLAERLERLEAEPICRCVHCENCRPSPKDYGSGPVQHLESKYITLGCQRCGFYARVEGDSDLPKHSCATNPSPKDND